MPSVKRISGPGDAKTPPYSYDDERTIALADVFEKSDSEIEKGLVGNPFTWSGEPSNLLVNGLGQLPGTTASSGCELASIRVEPDKTYRFRFIGGTALSFVTLAFQDHEEMTLIEADGNYVKPVTITYLQIGSGQRFSVLFKTKKRADLDPEKLQFFMQIETRDRPTLVRSYAVLEYKLPSSKRVPLPIVPRLALPIGKPPIELPPTTLGWLDHKLLSLDHNSDFPLTSEVTRRITVRTHQSTSLHHSLPASFIIP